MTLTISRLGQQEAPNYACYSLFLLAWWFSQTSSKYRVKVSLGPLPLPTTYGLIPSLFPNTLRFYLHTTDLLTTLSRPPWLSVAVLSVCCLQVPRVGARGPLWDTPWTQLHSAYQHLYHLSSPKWKLFVFCLFTYTISFTRESWNLLK